MSNASEEDSHGSSPAAWIAVTIMLVGCFIGTMCLFLNVMPLVYVGGVLMVVGLVVGAVLKRAGFGVGGSRVIEAHQPVQSDSGRAEAAAGTTQR